MAPKYTDIISSEAQLREILGETSDVAKNIVKAVLDEHCQAFIRKSPFISIASSNDRGFMDVSTKGDPPGFVRIVDNRTLAIPDRPGNQRGDTLTNILQNPKVGLCFLIPGKGETLRISGSAIIVRDRRLLESMAVNQKLPYFAIVVRVEEAFFLCAKSILRSKLWQSEYWPDLEGLPTLAQIIKDSGNVTESIEYIEEDLKCIYRDTLY